MDSDHYCKDKKENSDNFSDSCDFFQSARIRCSVCTCDEVDRVLLAYGFNFLLPIGVFLWTVLVCVILQEVNGLL